MYFAKINNDNIVEMVIVADQDYINSISGTWIQTDINGISPKNYAGIGYSWNLNLNGFIPPKPFNSWSLDEISCNWKAPLVYPSDGKFYKWDENSLSWVEWNIE